MAANNIEVWMRIYMHCWHEDNEADFLTLFTDDIHYMYTPFHPIMQGKEAVRAYHRSAMIQRDVAMKHEILAELDTHSFVRFWGQATMAETGRVTRLDGVMQVFFDETGLCSKIDEWWVSDAPWEGNIAPR